MSEQLLQDLGAGAAGQDAPLQQQPSLEDQARSMGWRPDAFDPADPKYKTAEQFVEQRTVDANYWRDQARTLETRLNRVELATQQALESQQALLKQQYEAQIAELQQVRDQAVQKGDLATYHQANEHIAQVQQQQQQQVAQPVQQQQQQQALDPEVAAFVSRNSTWYNVDAEKTALANAHAQQLANDVKAGRIAGMTVGQMMRAIEQKIADYDRVQSAMRSGGFRAPGGSHMTGTVQESFIDPATLPREVQLVARQMEASQKKMYPNDPAKVQKVMQEYYKAVSQSLKSSR